MNIKIKRAIIYPLYLKTIYERLNANRFYISRNGIITACYYKKILFGIKIKHREKIGTIIENDYTIFIFGNQDYSKETLNLCKEYQKITGYKFDIVTNIIRKDGI